MKICVGIISYLPDKEDIRKRRFEKLKKLINNLDYFFDLPILIVAQNWSEEDVNEIKNNNVNLFLFEEKLGIIGARIKLREIFLQQSYNYLIMLDDDCELVGDKESAKYYIKQIVDHPNMCGLFSDTILKLFAISKEVLKDVEFKEGSVEDGDFFEDILFVNTIKKLYPDKIFMFKRTNFRQISNNVNDKDSTWYWGQYNKHDIGDRTRAILGGL